MIGVRLGVGHHFSGGFDSSAQAFFTATGITGTTEQTAVNTLVTSLKSAGLWSKMKAVYPFVTDNRNLLSYTEAFDNGAWSKGGGTTVTANSTTAPDGTTTADTIVLPNTGTIAQPLVSATSQTFTFSIYLRASSNTTIKIGFVSPSIVTTCNVTTTWQRFTITHTFTGTTYPQLYNDTGASVTLFAWGAQVDAAATATTYQPIATTQQSFISNQFKYNLVNPVDSDAAFRGVFNGGWTFSNQGATPNGTNGYMDTKYKEVSADSNNFHISTYLRTNTAGAFGDMGVVEGLNETNIVSLLSNKFYGRIQGAEPNGIANTDSRGMFMANRTTSGQLKVIKNGTITSVSNNSTGISSTYNIYLSAFNINGSAAVYSPRQQAFSTIGNGLTDTEATALYNAVQTMNTTLNRQV